MRETLRCLIQLQHTDNQIHETSQMQEACRTREQELKRELDAKQETFQSKESTYEERHSQHQVKAELLLKEQSKLKKWERRLMESKNSREASALAREIDAQKRLNTETEEEVIRVGLENEELKAEVESLRQAVTSLTEEHSNESESASSKASEFDGKLVELNNEREELAGKLKSSLRRKYENIRNLRGGIAIAPARNGSCTGCNMHLRPQLYNIILRAQTLETCPSCKRILYSEEGLADGIA